MKLRWILLLLGIALSVLKWKKLIAINGWWIFLTFAICLVLFYFSIHQKNKDINTPRPVYMVNN